MYADEKLCPESQAGAAGDRLFIQPPHVSNDNPYAESLFRTLKYWPVWPHKGFAGLDEARQCVRRFVDWYSYAPSQRPSIF
jgi:hypothetical protein